MKLRILMDLDNQAYDGSIGHADGEAVGASLHGIAERIASAVNIGRGASWVIYDANGNKVGDAQIMGKRSS